MTSFTRMWKLSGPIWMPNYVNFKKKKDKQRISNMYDFDQSKARLQSGKSVKNNKRVKGMSTFNADQGKLREWGRRINDPVIWSKFDGREARIAMSSFADKRSTLRYVGWNLSNISTRSENTYNVITLVDEYHPEYDIRSRVDMDLLLAKASLYIPGF